VHAFCRLLQTSFKYFWSATQHLTEEKVLLINKNRLHGEMTEVLGSNQEAFENYVFLPEMKIN
jgi:hypothetical protein